MGFVDFLFIGVGLAMDAFAVSVCKGLSMKKIDIKYGAILALFFGGFQAVMPLIGWLLGSGFSKYITKVSHWIAFVLLLIIGGKMLIDAWKERNEEDEAEDNLKVDLKEFFLLAVATSIDALAVGVSFAFLEVKIVPAISVIGIVTFIISMGGVFIGNLFGSKFKNKAAVLGGIILICIGIKILLEGLGVIH